MVTYISGHVLAPKEPNLVLQPTLSIDNDIKPPGNEPNQKPARFFGR